jgi:hypothetical protein
MAIRHALWLADAVLATASDGRAPDRRPDSPQRLGAAAHDDDRPQQSHSTHRIARDEALSIGRCCSASSNIVSVHGRSFDARSEARHVAHILNQRHAVVTEASDPLCMFCMGAPQRGAAFNDLPSRVGAGRRQRRLNAPAIEARWQLCFPVAHHCGVMERRLNLASAAQLFTYPGSFDPDQRTSRVCDPRDAA